MDRKLKVAIVGYGIGGIAAAIQLRHFGHHIEHFDRHDPPTAAGAGMLLHPPAQALLAKLGVLEGAIARGAPVRHLSARTTSGQEIMGLSYPKLAAGKKGLGIQRGALHRLLSSADPNRNQVFTGCRIISTDPIAGTILDSAGLQHGPYDLVVVADGSRSALRQQLKAKVRVNRRSESAALVGLVDDPDGTAVDRMIQYHEPSRHVSIWPVGSEKPGRQRRCCVAMNIHQTDTPKTPDQDQWQQMVKEFFPVVGRLIEAQSEPPALQVYRYGDVEVEEHVIGRVVFIGDAAHSMSPQLGIGAQLALDDAAILAAAMDGSRDVTAALSNYQQTRPQQLRRLHRISRIVTPLFQSRKGLPSFFRAHLMRRVMRLPAIKQLTREIMFG